MSRVISTPGELLELWEKLNATPLEFTGEVIIIDLSLFDNLSYRDRLWFAPLFINSWSRKIKLEVVYIYHGDIRDHRLKMDIDGFINLKRGEIRVDYPEVNSGMKITHTEVSKNPYHMVIDVKGEICQNQTKRK
jgi:hypothetical protein